MNKNNENPNTRKSKKKLILMGTVFVICALLLKRDAH